MSSRNLTVTFYISIIYLTVVSLKRYQGPTSIIQPLSDEHFFCPGDSHSTPVITEVIQMRNDAIEQMSNFEEGQFDDA